MISIILAMAKNAVIGNNNEIPWYIPNDFAYFKKVTMGSTIIMGRKTWESIGKPLPGRKSVVITRNSESLKSEFENQFGVGVVEVCSSVEQAVRYVGDNDAFVIGGAEIYRQFMPIADKLYLTAINHIFEGDTKFKYLDLKNWKCVSSEIGERNAKNDYEYSFLVYERSNEDFVFEKRDLEVDINPLINVSEFSIRPIQSDEYTQWETLCSKEFDKKCEFDKIVKCRLGFEPKCVMGAFKGNQLVATATGIFDYTNLDNFAFIHMVCCDSNYRGRGLASSVINEVFKILKQEGFSGAWLKTQAYRCEAINLYKKLGFEQV